MHSRTLLTVLTIVTLNGASTWASPPPHLLNTARSSVSNGNAYTGTGGQANGGSVNNAGEDGYLLPLLDLFSGEAGDGGDASSGNAFGGMDRRESTQSNHNSYTGTAGQADGGNAYSAPALANAVSDNAGHGGEANSGHAGDLPPPSNAHSHSRTSPTHAHHHHRSNSVSNGNAFTGAGGQANGGSTNDGSLLAIAGDNAGSGGHAGSGDAYGAARTFSHSWGRKRDSTANGNAYTGNGGQANGGNVNCGDYDGLPALLNLFAYNAGDGGDASSGNAIGGSRRSDSTANGNAYTGTGGQANGGSVNGDCGALINIFSGSAGDGGRATSGSAKGGHE